MADIKDTLNKSAELLSIQPCTPIVPKLIKVGPTSYSLSLKKTGVPFEFSVTIEVPAAYPEKPTHFTVQAMKTGYKKPT